MSAGILINYLPAHMVYRTPEMQRIYDGFMPTSNGATHPGHRRADGPPADDARSVGRATSRDRQDGDEPGKQYRLYEFSGIAHIDTRDSVRLKPNPCAQPLSEFPQQAYIRSGCTICSSGWTRAPCRRAPSASGSIATSTTTARGWSLDEHGNPRGGIRNPYVDVPTAKYTIRPAGHRPA